MIEHNFTKERQALLRKFLESQGIKPCPTCSKPVAEVFHVVEGPCPKKP